MGYQMSEMFPSKYLKAEEFGEGEERVCIIRDVALVTLGEGAKAEEKFVLQFEDEKPLVLNKTNANIIAKLYGGNTDDWVGREIQLFTMEVDAFGDIVRSIRVRTQVPRRASVQNTAAAPTDAAPQASASGDNSPASQEMIDQIKVAGQKLWGGAAMAEIRKQTDGKPVTVRSAKVILDRIKEEIRKRDEAKAAPARDPFDDDDFDDSDPFADE